MYSQNINIQKKILGWSTCISQTFEGFNKADHGLSTSIEGKGPTISTARKKKHQNKKNNSTDKKSNQKRAKRREV